MVKNPQILERFERRLQQRFNPSYSANVKVVNALLRYAMKMGTFPPKNRLEGIEVDIRYAKAINSVR